ncbi:MAG: anthranilate synthase component I, partial [Prosthecobacter sp.]|nr:anthranilate synthase component I [Prosthecobacter sp.]
MSAPHLQPDLATFCTLAQQGNLVPVVAELTADYETPLSAFQKIHDGRCGFLLESAELTQHSGRYSLLGSSPRMIFTARGREIEIEERGKVRSFTTSTDPLEELKKLMAPFQPLESHPIPVFHGGAVGYLGYDMVRFFEPTLSPPPKDELGLPEMVYMITDTVVIFDHRTRKMSLVANVHTNEHATLEAAYTWAQAQITTLMDKLSQ